MMICLYPFEQSSLRSDDISILHKVRLYIIILMMYRIFFAPVSRAYAVLCRLIKGNYQQRIIHCPHIVIGYTMG